MGCHSGKQSAPVAVPHVQSNSNSISNRKPATPPPISPIREEGDPSKTLLLSRRYSPSDQANCGAKFPPPGTESSFDDPKIDAITNVAAEDTSPDPMQQDVRVSREAASSSSTRSDSQGPHEFDSLAMGIGPAGAGQDRDGSRGVPHPQVPRLCEVWEDHYQHHQHLQGRGAHRGASAARHGSFRNESPPSNSLYVETVPEASAMGIMPLVEGPSDLCRDSRNANPGGSSSDFAAQDGQRSIVRHDTGASSAVAGDRMVHFDLGPADSIASTDISGFGRLSYREGGATRPGDVAAPKAVKMSRGFANDDDDTAVVPEDAAWSGVAGHFEYIAARSQEALNTACCGHQAQWPDQITNRFCTNTGLSEQPTLEEVSAFLGGCCTIPSPNRHQ